ncbi:MAG: MoaF N-terminal domain-containing protein [Oscillospiraceae bacterium]|jgi:hypothetical protein|nr:MoaF N-terminal domain-containing protein [Oscillospiraceae bacterium]
MDLKKLNAFGGGSAIIQYTPPMCYELAGERLEFAMDDGFDFILNFTDHEKLEWSWAGEAPKTADYMCLKADDTTYLLSYELADVTPRVNHTWVIDKENMLVTRLLSRIGTNPKYPYLMKTDYVFGAIREEGKEVGVYPRHGFTSDIIGNVVQWAYASEMATVHVYYCTDFYRITYPRDPSFSEEAKKMNDMFATILKDIPSSDEPTKYIKIKEGMYLFSLTEANGEKLLGANMGFRSNTMCFLQNFKRVYQMGRTFGTSTTPNGDTKTHAMIGAYGKIVEERDDALNKMLSDPNPYLID